MHLYNPKLYLRDYWIGPLFFVAILAQIFMWWYLLVNIRPTGEQLFLHYNSVFGVDLLGSYREIFYLPAGGLAILVFNYLVSWYFYGSDKFLARVLSFWSVLVSGFLALAVYLIAGLNI